MSKRSASPAPSNQPTHLILFREPSERNVGILSSALKVGEARGVRSRSSCAILSEKNGVAPKVFGHLGVAAATLSPAEVKQLKAKDEVEDVVKNELRSIPPVVIPSEAEEVEPGASAAAPATDPFVAYLQGLRDAVDLALRFKTGAAPDIGGLVSSISFAGGGGSRLAWHLQLIGVAESGSLTGAGVKAAVLDTGIDLKHPDFKNRVVDGETAKSFVNGESVQDGNGHGTHCAGLVGGVRNPRGQRRYGVAPDVSLLVGKVLNDEGDGFDSQILDGMDWAADMGAKVISMSLGSERGKGKPHAVAYERLAAVLQRQGIVIIAAAGNSSDRPGLVSPVENPAACPSLMAVAAVDRSKRVAPFSCATMDAIGEVNISAPGVSVYSSYTGGTYKSISGTSMATPIVAGVAALLWQKHPAASAKEIWDALLSTAVSLGSANDFGAGLVQAPR